MASQETLERKLEAEGFTMVMGDIDLTYGQTWVRDNGDYFDIIETVDLDSACGADGQILVQAKHTSFGFLSTNDHKSVQRSHDTASYLPAMARKDRSFARLAYAQIVASYGIADPAGYGDGWFVVVFDRMDEKDAREQWTKNRVSGWGYAAIERAIDNALACIDNGGMFLPHNITD